MRVNHETCDTARHHGCAKLPRHVDRKYCVTKIPSVGVMHRLDTRSGNIGSVSERRALFSIVKPPRPRRVLLIEDDHDVRRVIALALRRTAIEVVEAETAEQARHVFAAADIDAVVTDIALPGDMDGMM